MAEKTIAEIARLCADCGTCQSACPVYGAELSEPNSPRGKVNLIKAADDGRLEPNARNRALSINAWYAAAAIRPAPTVLNLYP